MSILGSLIQKGARLGALAGQQVRATTAEHQQKQLIALLRQARNTAFGRHHGFSSILFSSDPTRAFREQVPATDYHGIYDRWWQQAHLCDSPDVCWPGIIPYFALSSGTSQAASKYIPVTEDMLRYMRRGSRRMLFDMAHYGLTPRHFTKHMLMVGSCTSPKREGLHYSGDLSGIIGLNRPGWMERFYRPGRHITDLPDWDERIARIADEAPQWDVGFAVANPMWLQLILERIISQYHLNNIHDLWPNFSVYVHGGVFFEPYRASFEHLLGKPVHYVNSYLASEGFFAYQQRPGESDMRLLPDAGIYFELVPFNAKNFDDNGDLRSPEPETHTLENAEPGQTYALLISTCSGAWRYLLGDTVVVTDPTRGMIRINGRTKQFLSVCGEHLSIDNLNAAVQEADVRLNAGIREFAVAGVREGTYWAHQWYVSMDNPRVSADEFAKIVDEALCRLNDDYAIERQYVLRKVHVDILPNAKFMGWLEQKGKFNGQAKIPRVLKSAQLVDFQAYLKSV
ncbi:MAG: GH3 auxin-responsive promoter family protein [Saprospiraceae bacterium]|nr:GH3 auxin-responsive promoter family protein [Saprospiraceae bacterium]MCC6413188.1 GH3 auxin-responsive promoter family protein [Saprospiraceae bacterium]